MSMALRIAKGNKLFHLIKRVSDENGGDEVEWLREYAKYMAESFKDDLDCAIICFGILCSTNKENSTELKKRPFKLIVCKMCNMRPPFCYEVENGYCSNVPCRT